MLSILAQELRCCGWDTFITDAPETEAATGWSAAMQELHTDAPHGPWAFVLSLTPRERAFAGGQTLLMQPRVLNYWPDFDPSAGLEMKHLVQALLALLNALPCFDA